MFIRKADLLMALKRSTQLASRKAKHPFHLVSLDVHHGELAVTATDGETWLRALGPCEGDPFTAGVEASALLDVVKQSGHDDSVEIVLDRHRIRVRCNGQKTVLKSHPVDAMPVVSEAETRKWRHEAEWGSEALRDALAWVLLAVSCDDTRPQLSSILVHGDVLVACDGHRLHRARFADEQLVYRTLVPGSCARVVATVLEGRGRVVLERSERLVRFRTRNVQVIATACEREFPPYEQIIPGPGSERLRIDVEAARLHSALKGLPGKKPNGRILMTINGKLTLASAPWETDRRSAPIGLPLRASTHQGPDFVIGINHRYLSEAIGEAGIRSVRFHDDGSPIVISDQDDERLAVVMPMRL